MFKRTLLATSVIALLGSPAALAGGACPFGHSYDTAQTAEANIALPQSQPAEPSQRVDVTAPSDNTETAETTVASMVEESPQE
jgi:hypothetical protein